ncbi:MAG: SWIM zinc finger family protein [Candidatus Micrarchaeia archaeon]
MGRFFIKKIFLVKSFTNDDVYYEVDPELRTCTCPDFLFRKDKYSLDDSRRLCKHLKIVIEYLNKKKSDKVFVKGLENKIEEVFDA